MDRHPFLQLLNDVSGYQAFVGFPLQKQKRLWALSVRHVGDRISNTLYFKCFVGFWIESILGFPVDSFSGADDRCCFYVGCFLRRVLQFLTCSQGGPGGKTTRRHYRTG